MTRRIFYTPRGSAWVRAGDLGLAGLAGRPILYRSHYWTYDRESRTGDSVILTRQDPERGTLRVYVPTWVRVVVLPAGDQVPELEPGDRVRARHIPKFK